MVATTSVVASPRLSRASLAAGPRVRSLRVLGCSGSGAGVSTGAEEGPTFEDGLGRRFRRGGREWRRGDGFNRCALGGLPRPPLCGLGFAGRYPLKTGSRHRARLVVDGFLAHRAVEPDTIRITQDRSAVGFSRLPNHQDALGVLPAPAKRLLQIGRHVRERADFMGPWPEMPAATSRAEARRPAELPGRRGFGRTCCSWREVSWCFAPSKDGGADAPQQKRTPPTRAS